MGNIAKNLCNSDQTYQYRPEETIETEESFIQFQTYKDLHDESFCHFQERLNDKSFAEWYEKPSRAKEDINIYYCTIKDIGSGYYGRVTKAFLRREKFADPQQSLRIKVLSEAKSKINKLSKKRLFAIKNINKKRHKGKLGLFMKEIEFMKNIDHPNVIKFYEVFEDKEELHLVMEYCKGGDLHHWLKEKNRFSESQCRNILYQILRSVAHIHNKKICHRDLKPDNFLLKKKNMCQLKLIDFGLSHHFKNKRLKDMVGTPYYMAPEVINGSYNEKCDIWSVGVIFYYLATGKLPFDGHSKQALFEKILEGQFEYSLLKSMGISKKGRNFLRMMMKPENERLSAVEALQNPWFHADIHRQLAEFDPELISGNLVNLLNFQITSIFQREVIGMMVKIFTDSRKVKKLSSLFHIFDSSNVGVLREKELKKLFENSDKKLTEEDLKRVVNSLYIYEKSGVSYSEFIAAMLPPQFFTNEVRLKIIFNYLDSDHDGKLSFSDIESCFQRFGRDLEKEKIKTMIHECEDQEYRGPIDFKKFKYFMKSRKKNQNGIKGRSGFASTDYN